MFPQNLMFSWFSRFKHAQFRGGAARQVFGDVDGVVLNM